MTTAPTAEQFLAMQDTEDDEFTAEIHDTGDPLESIADSLRTLVQVIEAPQREEQASARLQEAFDDLEEKHQSLFGLLAEVEKIVKPSTSKVSLEVKAAIDAWKSPEVPQALTADEVAVHGLPTGGKSPCGVHYMADASFSTDPTCPECVAAEEPVPASNAAEMGHPQPDHDAAVEQWREFARGLGYQGPDIDKANRSQIRTMLGIEQPS